MRVDRLYDFLAPIYDRVITPLDGTALSRAVERLKAGEPRTILEVAVGAGRGLRELVERTKAVVTAVDSSPGAIAVARRAATDSVRLARANSMQLPFKDGAFDAVVSTYLIELLSADEGRQVLMEMSRVTAPGGRMVVGVLQVFNPIVQKALGLAERVAPELLGQRPLMHLSGLLPLPGFRLLLDETIQGAVGMRLFTMVKTG
ncbi:MAG TPA: class I SAM-dependent methyltransferase [Gemmatimonadales bacterium]